MIKRPRDHQLSRVYTAEAKCWGHGVKRVSHKSVRILETLPELAVFVLKILRSPELHKLYGSHMDAPIEVGDGRGTRRAYAFGTYKITMPKWSRTNALVIHEVAHVLNNRCHRLPAVNAHTANIKAGDGSSHGITYTRVYLDIVKALMGEDAFMDLQRSFGEFKVKVM